MDIYGGMTPTLRRISGPVAELVEVVSDRGLKHFALVFPHHLRARGELRSALQAGLGFMERTGVDGLANLVFHDPTEGLFIYPTGTVWSVAEVLGVCAADGRPAGARAGLELLYQAGQVLLEAASVGADEGVFSHGSLSPWRIFVRADGQVRVIGYGITQPELALYREDPAAVPGEDSLRFAPPERLEGNDEDFTSDLLALALIVFEMITGRPVYEGTVADIERQASRGEGQRRLYQLRHLISTEVREVLSRCMKYDPDSRFQDGDDFVYSVKDLLTAPDLEGPSLMELMGRVADQVGASEAPAPPAPLEEAAAPEVDPNQSRFGGRSRRAAVADELPLEPSPAPSGRSGGLSGRPGVGRGLAPRRSAEPEPSTEEPAGGRRLRRGAAPPEDDASPRRVRRGPEGTPPAPAAPGPEIPRLRRSRFGAEDAATDADAPRRLGAAPDGGQGPAPRRAARGLDEDGGPAPRRSRGGEPEGEDQAGARSRRLRGGPGGSTDEPEGELGAARRLARGQSADEELSARRPRRTARGDAPEEPQQDDRATRRRRGRDDDDVTGARRITRRGEDDASDAPQSAADRLKARTKGPPSPVEPLVADAPPAEEEELVVQRRRRRRGGEDPPLSSWRVVLDQEAEQTLEVRASGSVASLLYAITEALVGRGLGLGGQLESWIALEDGPPPTAPLRALSEGGPLRLRTVLAKMIRLRLDVDGASQTLVVSSGLTVRELRGGLAGWLRRPARRILWGGQELDELLVLGSLSDAEELDMVVVS
ncbi:MAG: hypothetical protein JXX28_04890 [Deltaproteobacteria bacterium]|nr:hypothetical protein [Deltaproteobacteria bacterium]